MRCKTCGYPGHEAIDCAKPQPSTEREELSREECPVCRMFVDRRQYFACTCEAKRSQPSNDESRQPAPSECICGETNARNCPVHQSEPDPGCPNLADCKALRDGNRRFYGEIKDLKREIETLKAVIIERTAHMYAAREARNKLQAENERLTTAMGLQRFDFSRFDQLLTKSGVSDIDRKFLLSLCLTSQGEDLLSSPESAKKEGR